MAFSQYFYKGNFVLEVKGGNVYDPSTVIQQEGYDEDVMVFHLHKLYVMPSMHGKGIGRLLFNQAQEHVSNRFVSSRIELNVNRMNAAVQFYRHIGMRVLREGDFHIGEGFYMNDYIMGIDVLRQN